jgi:hypothetical protein
MMLLVRCRVLAILVGLILAIPAQANACAVASVCRCVARPRPDSAGAITANEIVGSSRAVFAGRVRSTIVPKTGVAVALVEVQRVWHGEVGETASVIFHSNLPAVSSCDIELRAGDEYLFFLLPSRDTFGTDIGGCSGTQRLAGAESALRALGPGRSPG